MLTNDRERRICAKYSAIDEQGHVHCNECPLNKGNHRMWGFRCKATCHYNRRTREWEFDVQTKGVDNVVERLCKVHKWSVKDDDFCSYGEREGE